MKVLFVASECAPFAKVGGLGDVIGSLPKALSKIGVDAMVIIPFYEEIDRKKWRPKLILKLDNETFVYKTRLPHQHSNIPRNVRMLARNDDGVEVFLVYNKKYLSTGPIYFEKTAFVGSKKEIDRFVFFSKAVYELLKHPKFFKPDIVHCNDWHTGTLVKLLKSHSEQSEESQGGPSVAKRPQDDSPRVIFTIHNLANQGKWNGRNLMAEGIKNADKVTTVSQTYAKEILTKEYGEGLANLLKKRKKDLIGILNGIDYNFWPRPPRHHPRKRSGDQPRFGFVARLTSQKGLGLIFPIVLRLVEEENAIFKFLGQGLVKYENALLGFAKQYPPNIFVKIGFDEKLAYKIYTESDFFLMPSIFEPSGLGQMISMHYGTIPIVRATGGLKDTVRHLKTGFAFKQKTSAALYGAVKTALKYFHSPEKLEKIRKNCLKENFSWGKSAKRYKKLYNAL